MITEPLAAQSVLRMSECMSYFPKSEVFTSEMVKLLFNLIGRGNNSIVSVGVSYTPVMRLEWLTQALIHGVGKWPEEGMREVRAIYCCKFKPADGREEYSSLPGFSPQDQEAGGSSRSSFLSAPPVEQPYLPQPGDEPIGEEITEQLKRLVAAKTVKGDD